MTRLADRLLRGCDAARPSMMEGVGAVERFGREQLSHEAQAGTGAQDLESRVSAGVRRFLATELVSSKRFDPNDLDGAPIFVGDDIATYVDSLPLGTDFTEVVGSMAPPFDRFFVEFQGVPNRFECFAWGALVQAHDYSEQWGRFDDDEGAPRWILEFSTFMESQKGHPFGPVATHVAGLAEDGTWFRHSDGAVWWGGGCVGFFTPEPPPDIDKNWGDYVAQMLFPVLLTISFLHCRNVEIREVAPPPALARKHRKKHGTELVRYHVLEVAQIQRLLEAHRSQQPGGLRRALHICRGHFKTFTPDAPLLGRHTGTYWWAPQVRGSLGAGVVVKDYRVAGPLQLGKTYREADESQPSVERRVAHTADPDGGGQGLVAHNRTQNALAQIARSLGLAPLSPREGEPKFDFAFTRGNALFVCEVKSLTPVNEEKQLRVGLGQVIRYRQKLTAAGHEPVFAVLATETEPLDKSWSDLLTDEGIILVWPAVAETRLRVAFEERGV